MPTIRRAGTYRFFFWSNERAEPPHIHVESGDRYAKVWLAPVRVAKSEGYNPKHLRFVLRLVEQHREEFLERWHDYFSNR